MLEESQRELKPPNILTGSFRGTKSLFSNLPPPLSREGDKRGRVAYKNLVGGKLCYKM